MKYSEKIFLFFSLLFSTQALAQVKYDEGAIYVQGLTFLQGNKDTTEYYYLPQFPRLSSRPDGTLEFLCLQYVNKNAQTSGGLLHALVEFSIPDSILQRLEIGLKKINPLARIAGMVPLMQYKKEADDDLRSGFEVVSATLNTAANGTESMARSVVTSGYAPFTPGSKAAVAALLNANGATLMWNSFSGQGASDVSLAVNGYYEAAVRAYNAVVTAEMKVIYTHFSKMYNQQQKFTKTQIRKVVDSLEKKGFIKVDVFDRSAGLGVKTTDMDGILSTITNKITETMFDSQNGWSKEPERVDPNLGFDPRGKQGDKTKVGTVAGEIAEAIGDINESLPIIGLFTKRAKKNLDPEYVTDNQFVLKDVKNIRTSTFYLNLSKQTTIKVPFHTAGNLGGLFSKIGQDSRYFRIVNMEDPAFERRSINFQVDGDFVDAFDDVINFVTVNFRKKYSTGGHSDVTSQLLINGDDVKKKISIKEISYPRLGITSSDWLNYEYQIIWSFKGRPNPVRFPENENQWIKSSDPAISLIPPLVKVYMDVDADRREFLSNAVASARIKFATKQAGVMKVVRTVILRADDKSSTNKIAIYHDPNVPVAYQTSWFKNSGTADDANKLVSSGFLFLNIPTADKFIKSE